jgi:Ran GTPase-activating protein (RanGAP) involved in mRNA processing and transport
MLKVNGALKKYTDYDIIIRLLLEWNCIGIWDNGVSNLSEALTLNMTLEELDLRNNKIGPQGVQILAASLKHNTCLRRIGKKQVFISRLKME